MPKAKLTIKTKPPKGEKPSTKKAVDKIIKARKGKGK